MYSDIENINLAKPLAQHNSFACGQRCRDLQFCYGFSSLGHHKWNKAGVHAFFCIRAIETSRQNVEMSNLYVNQTFLCATTPTLPGQ